MSLEYRIGDVFDRMAEIPDGSIDLIVTSPPFLALRSYLPADHPDKGKEIGSEATPAAFIDTLLALSAEWGRVLAPHGSLCVELGDTYAGRVATATPIHRTPHTASLGLRNGGRARVASGSSARTTAGRLPSH
jgi:DNA modification methylase